MPGYLLNVKLGIVVTGATNWVVTLIESPTWFMYINILHNGFSTWILQFYLIFSFPLKNALLESFPSIIELWPGVLGIRWHASENLCVQLLLIMPFNMKIYVEIVRKGVLWIRIVRKTVLHLLILTVGCRVLNHHLVKITVYYIMSGTIPCAFLLIMLHFYRNSKGHTVRLLPCW